MLLDWLIIYPYYTDFSPLSYLVAPPLQEII